MRANETRLNKLLAETDRKFTIPIYQRKYSWTEKQCLTLWEDIKKLSETSPNAGHFIGSIVCYQLNDEDMPGVIKEKIVIDGQQRLTTLSLIMLAMIRNYEKKGEEGERIAKSIKRQYILNEEFTGEDRYKLVPTYEDKDTYFAIINETENELQNYSKQMLDNFNLFCDLLSDDTKVLEKIYSGINKLDLVYIVLSKTQDNPQLIFESMNSTGMLLSQGDLLRNFLLLDVDTNEQNELYEKYWKPIELDFGHDDYVEKFDYFLRDYLTMLEHKTVKLDMGYEEFKDYYEDSGISKKEMLIDLRRYSKYYSRIYRCIDNDTELNNLWREIKIQRMDVANPFLIKVYSDYEEAQENHTFELSKADFIEIIKAINSYVYRRYIVGIPTNSLNKTFAVLYNSVDKNNYKVSVLAALILLDSYKEFPDDEEFKKAFAYKDIYNSRLKNYTLEKLENSEHLNKITIDGKDISIEHILPETDELKKHWQEVLGENWKEIQKNNMHRIGNLTITKGVYNSQMSDLPFKDKLNVVGGIKDSHYRISDSVLFCTDENNQKIERTIWNLDSINERSELLAEQAVNIWKYPALSEEQLKPYKNINKQEKVIYENMNHFPEMSEDIKNVFEQFDKAILDLDQNITKMIAKHYIAYKYDYSNFAEIIIYKNSINIILDIPYEDLEDELNLVENISDKGSWGTGNCRIKVNSSDNLEYIMSLINASFQNEKNSD